MDTFSLIVTVGFALGLLALLAIGRFYPGSGADVLDWKPTRSPQAEAQNELDDIAQMLDAQNALRARRGLPPRTEEEVEEALRRDKADLDAKAAAYWEERRAADRGEWPAS